MQVLAQRVFGERPPVLQEGGGEQVVRGVGRKDTGQEGKVRGGEAMGGNSESIKARLPTSGWTAGEHASRKAAACEQRQLSMSESDGHPSSSMIFSSCEAMGEGRDVRGER